MRSAYVLGPALSPSRRLIAPDRQCSNQLEAPWRCQVSRCRAFLDYGEGSHVETHGNLLGQKPITRAFQILG
jgi:hypothetical protein